MEYFFLFHFWIIDIFLLICIFCSRVYAMFGQEGPERILELEAHSDRVDSIQWANSGLRFISGSKDGTALLWRYEHQEWRTIRLRMTSRLAGQASSERANAEDDADARNQKLKVTMVTWSLDDRWLVTAVSDFSLKLWDSSTGKILILIPLCLYTY